MPKYFVLSFPVTVESAKGDITGDPSITTLAAALNQNNNAFPSLAPPLPEQILSLRREVCEKLARPARDIPLTRFLHMFFCFSERKNHWQNLSSNLAWTSNKFTTNCVKKVDVYKVITIIVMA